MSQTILVVDDEKRLVSLVKSYLEQEGYRVLTAYNGREALDVVAGEDPDLIVLDVMMPEMDGYAFMREHRAQNNTPIILLTARVDDDEKVIGLELGADDYITKPFRPRELVARVRAVLRRAGQNTPKGEVIEASDITLDRSTRSQEDYQRMNGRDWIRGLFLCKAGESLLPVCVLQRCGMTPELESFWDQCHRYLEPSDRHLLERLAQRSLDDAVQGFSARVVALFDTVRAHIGI